MRRPSLVIAVAPTSVAAERTIFERVDPDGVGWQHDGDGVLRLRSADVGGIDTLGARCVRGEWTGVVTHPTRVAIATAVMMKIVRIVVIGR